MKCWVYWLHLASHTDILTQGYVGITTLGVEERFKRHVSASKKLGRRQVVSNAIAKHGADNIKVDTVLISELAYCQDFENKLRPAENIGWNLAVGGASTAAGRKNSPEHVAKVAAAQVGKRRSPEAVEANRLRGKSQLTFTNPWDHPYSNKEAWSRAIDIAACPGIGRRGVHKRFGIPPDSAMKVVNKIKEGWNPSQDVAYQQWLAKYKERADGSQPL